MFDFLHSRRRSKSHHSSLHSYCVSGGGRGGQLYDDLYLSGHLPRLSNTYTTNTFYNRNQVSTENKTRPCLSLWGFNYVRMWECCLFVPQSELCWGDWGDWGTRSWSVNKGRGGQANSVVCWKGPREYYQIQYQIDLYFNTTLPYTTVTWL